MKNSLDCKKLLSYGKELSIFAGIFLVLLFVFSCNNILMRNSGSLVITVPGARAASASTFTIELTGSSGSPQSKTISSGATVQFYDLAPDTYTINVKGMDDAGTVVLSGSATATVVAGETTTVPVELQKLLGSLTVNFEGAESDSVEEYRVTLSGPGESKETKEVESRSVSFEGLIPGDYTVSVSGQDTDGNVVLYGTSDAAVEAGATTSAELDLMGVVNDLSSLQQAVTAGGIVYIGSDINVASPLTVNTDVTLLPAYKNVTLTNNSSGNLFTVADSSGNLTIGGGEYTITLDGNQVAQSIISVSGGTATLADNGIITNAAASGIKISSSGTFEMTGGEISKNKESSTSYGGGGVTISGGTFNMTGGEISNNESSTYNGGGGITISGGIFNMTGGRIIDNTGSQSSGGVTVYSATFNMTGGTIKDNTGSFGGAVSLVSGTFDMSGGSITGNTVTSSGGGVQVSGGTFVLSGGSISNNSASNGSGVYMSTGSFQMRGSATVDLSNDVYLSSSKVITVAGTLSGTTPVATITPSSYTADIQVLSLGNYILEVSKFALTPDPAGSQWTISDTGYLQQVQ